MKKGGEMKEETIYIRGKKMRRVKIGRMSYWLLPYWPDDKDYESVDEWYRYKGKDGVETYSLLGCVFYKKGGRYYVEVPEKKKE